MLEGSKLILRKADTPDIPDLAQWLLDPEICLNLSGSPAQSREDTTKMLELSIPGLGTYNEDLYLIFEEKSSGKKVGFCVLQQIDWKNRSVSNNLGVALKEDRGKSYGPQMIVLSWRYIYYELGMQTMTFQIHAFNERMLNITQKLADLTGIKPAGRLRQHVIRDGKAFDSILYCITRPEIDAVTAHPDLKPLL